MENQKAIWAIVIIVVIAVVGGVSWYIVSQDDDTNTVVENEVNTNIEVITNVEKELNSDSQIIEGHSSSDNSINVTLVHDKSKSTSLNDDFVITDDTHIALRLHHQGGPDGPWENILVQDFSDIDELPFIFSIFGDLDKTFAKDSGYYLLSAKVYKHSGDEVYVGDLVSEIQTEVDPNDSNIEIKVFGMEDCDAPYRGGFCTSEVYVEN